MAFNPNQLLNNPTSLLSIKAQGGVLAGQVQAEPVPAPVYDKKLYENAYARLGLLRIDNVVDLGCGPGNFTGVMVDRNQRPEVYLGVDMSHQCIQTAKSAYPGWSFIYGDFTSPQVRQQYERYDAFLLLNVLDVVEDDLGFVESIPSEKPVLFSMPKFPKSDSVRYYDDISPLRERYSNFLSIKSVGRLTLGADEHYYMVVAVRW
jgi:trans-aconitate methyltransferase